MHVQRGDNNCKHQSIILLKANAKRILCTGVSKGQMGFFKVDSKDNVYANRTCILFEFTLQMHYISPQRKAF